MGKRQKKIFRTFFAQKSSNSENFFFFTSADEIFVHKNDDDDDDDFKMKNLKIPSRESDYHSSGKSQSSSPKILENSKKRQNSLRQSIKRSLSADSLSKMGNKN